jgi:tetratricopeptide (TPR) repeat protein
MASIPLRNYIREIEGFIDTGLCDEAIAHCRHILSIYPKNISCYRLLGKAHLESERYGDAVDIFQRVLSAMPDDFVSHIGMSIIREDERNMDAAIWHMERAFEAQPANPAIQDELRRLYGRRDGLEPPKIRLTRGALARMYANGNLYEQSISELRGALADDPRRPDLLVLLARMYYLAGQRVEAVDTSSNLLKAFPFCLEANRILSVILPDVNRVDDAQVYHQRVIALDPYFTKADPHSISPNDVPDNAVIIEHLDLRPGESPSSSQPAWAATLGLAISEKPSDEIPDWLSGESESSISQKQIEAEIMHVSPFTEDNQETQITPESDQYIPDWMKAAGWGMATGEFKEGEGAPIFEDVIPSQTEGDIAAAEIPDWLKAVAPEGILEVDAQAELAPMGQAEPVPFLDENPPDVVDIESGQPGELFASSPLSDEIGPTQSRSDEQIPDLPEWLREELEPISNLDASPTTISPESELELPDWQRARRTTCTHSNT